MLTFIHRDSRAGHNDFCAKKKNKKTEDDYMDCMAVGVRGGKRKTWRKGLMRGRRRREEGV